MKRAFPKTHHLLVLGLAAAGLVAAGCTAEAPNEEAPGETASTETKATTKTPSVSAADVRKEASETADALSGYMQTQRAKFEAEAESTTEELGAAIEAARDSASQKVAGITDDANEALEDAIDRAEDAQQKVDRELEALEDATANQWKAAESRLAAAIDEAAEARREISLALAGRPTNDK